MAEFSYPSPNHNSRAVTEEEYENITRSQGVGLYGVPADPALIFGDSSGMQVKVRADQVGRIRGFTWESGGTIEAHAIGANGAGSDRIDLLVLRLTRATWDVTVEVVAGTAGNPAPSPVIDGAKYEMPLAEVTVKPGDLVIPAAQVKNRAWYFGTIAGEYLCLNTDSRPPVAEGLKLHETSTGRGYVGIGGSWLLTYENSGLTVVAMRAGWSFFVNRIQRRNGLVSLALSAKRSGGNIASSGAFVPIADIPDGFRPAWSYEVPTFHLSNNGPSMASVGSDGVIQMRAYGGINTNGAVIFPLMTYLLA
jgi:hypothetical protein